MLKLVCVTFYFNFLEKLKNLNICYTQREVTQFGVEYTIYYKSFKVTLKCLHVVVVSENGILFAQKKSFYINPVIFKQFERFFKRRYSLRHNSITPIH